MKRTAMCIALTGMWSISIAAMAAETLNLIDCSPRFGLSGRYTFPNGATGISFDSQDVLQVPVGAAAPAGRYDLFVRVAASEGQPANHLTQIEVGLGDAIANLGYLQPSGLQWIGPVALTTTIPAGSIDLRGTEHVMIDCFRLVPAGSPVPAEVEKPMANQGLKEINTLWLDWPTYPAWVVEDQPAMIRVRAAGTGEAKVRGRIFNFEHKEVGTFNFSVALNKPQAAQAVPLPKPFGPYLLRFFVTLPGKSEYEFQRITARVKSPLKFTCDRFGGHGNIPLLEVIGGGWNRMWDSGGSNTFWSSVEPEPGKFVWNDQLPASPTVKPLALLEREPGWFTKGRYEGLNTWLNYVRQTVTHFKGRIPVYEICNEPYETPTDEFARKHVGLVVATAKVIRECDPKALVTAGGPPEEIPPGLDWWKALARHGLLKPLDLISAHLYFGGGGTYPLDQDLRFDVYATGLRKICDQYGGKGKPIWDTESGLCPMETFYAGRNVTYGAWSGKGFTPRDPVPYRVGTAMAARYLMLHFWHDIRWNYYHTTGACYGNSWALCDFDETPLPAAATLAQMSRLFADAQADGKPQLPAGLWGLFFKTPKESILTLWAVDLKVGEKRFLSLPEADVEILDLFGNPAAKSARMEIGMYPLIFRGSRSTLDGLAAGLKVASEIDASVAGPAQIDFCLTDPKGKNAPTLTASSTFAGFTVDPVRDRESLSGGTPKDCWSSKSGPEHWLEYRWSEPQTIHRLVCAWPTADLPKGYKVEWFDGAVWHACSGTPDWRSPGMPHEDYTITAVKTDRLRMVIRGKGSKPAKVSEFAAYYIPRLTPPISEMQEIWSRDFKPSEKGFIRDWLICGPFPSPGLRYKQEKKPANWNEDLLDTNWIYGFGHGEPVIKPTVGKEHVARFPAGTQAPWKPMAVRVAWQPVHAGDDIVDLAERFINNMLSDKSKIVEQCLGYACTYLDVPADISAEMRVGSDDGYKIWIDDKVVAENVVFRQAIVDQEKYPVTLTKGRHRILVKLHNDIGGHELCLRFTDAKGTPVTNYTVRLAP